MCQPKSSGVGRRYLGDLASLTSIVADVLARRLLVTSMLVAQEELSTYVNPLAVASRGGSGKPCCRHSRLFFDSLVPRCPIASSPFFRRFVLVIRSRSCNHDGRSSLGEPRCGPSAET